VCVELIARLIKLGKIFHIKIERERERDREKKKKTIREYKGYKDREFEV
jgi:hypothetical protein